MFKMKRAGYWFSEEKGKKLGIHTFADNYQADDLQYVPIDLSRPLEDQGPFDIIVHKLLDLVVKMDGGCEVSRRQMSALQTYLSGHPEVICIDPLDRIRPMLNRYDQHLLTAKCVDSEDLKGRVFVPPTCLLDSPDAVINARKLRASGVSFPIVCKPELAHGSNHAHEMCLAFDEQGLQSIFTPSVTQAFINHNAKLFKIFAVGPWTYICERPSIKNLFPGDQKTLFFHSHDVSKEESNCDLTELDEEDRYLTPHKPDPPLFRQIANVIRREFRLDLFGADVIAANDALPRSFAIIDINMFPGYEKVPTFFTQLDRLVRSKVGLGSHPSAPTDDTATTCSSSSIDIDHHGETVR